jgi:hypothetical protein
VGDVWQEKGAAGAVALRQASTSTGPAPLPLGWKWKHAAFCLLFFWCFVCSCVHVCLLLVVAVIYDLQWIGMDGQRVGPIARIIDNRSLEHTAHRPPFHVPHSHGPRPTLHISHHTAPRDTAVKTQRSGSGRAALKIQPAPPGTPFGVHLDRSGSVSMADLEVCFLPPRYPQPPSAPPWRFLSN